MNKKFIKTLASIACGLGIVSSIPFVSTSCNSKKTAIVFDNNNDDNQFYISAVAGVEGVFARDNIYVPTRDFYVYWEGNLISGRDIEWHFTDTKDEKEIGFFGMGYDIEDPSDSTGNIYWTSDVIEGEFDVKIWCELFKDPNKILTFPKTFHFHSVWNDQSASITFNTQDSKKNDLESIPSFHNETEWNALYLYTDIDDDGKSTKPYISIVLDNIDDELANFDRLSRGLTIEVEEIPEKAKGITFNKDKSLPETLTTPILVDYTETLSPDGKEIKTAYINLNYVIFGWPEDPTWKNQDFEFTCKFNLYFSSLATKDPISEKFQFSETFKWLAKGQ